MVLTEGFESSTSDYKSFALLDGVIPSTITTDKTTGKNVTLRSVDLRQ
jgi:hypothetical protein